MRAMGALRRLRLAHEAHDLLQRGLGADPRRAEPEAPVVFIVAPIHRRSGALSTGIDSPVSIDSSTADAPSITSPSTGIRSPGRTSDDVAAQDVAGGHFELDAVANDAGRARLQADEPPDGLRRPAARARLEQLAEQHEDDDDDSRFEVDGCRLVAADDVRVGGNRRRRNRGDIRVDERRAGADGDERVHVGREVPHGSSTRRGRTATRSRTAPAPRAPTAPSSRPGSGRAPSPAGRREWPARCRG